MQEWRDISYGFHNSRATWPNDRHAWQQLSLYSLTKLGVHWVCVGCKTCNVECTFRTHWMKCISLERQKRQDKLWEKEFEKYKLQLFPPEICTSFFSADIRKFFLPPYFPFYFTDNWVPMETRGKSDSTGWALFTNTGSGGNKWTLGPCSTCGPPQCASQPSKL